MATVQAAILVETVIVGADNPALDGAHMVGIVEGKVGGQAEGPALFPVQCRTVGFADVLDQGDASLFQLLEQVFT